ncbi:MAG: hypothetical protein E7231_13505 [Cellulosilyticum sp.]|nr:hypothetical protein [Cellulosilyticum sp.]
MMTRQECFKLVDELKMTQEKQMLFPLEIDEKLMLTEEGLKQMHQVLGGTGKYRTGSLTVEPIGIMPPEASELERLMGHFISQLQISKQMFHPIEYATICHKRILELYPFEDKNEEVAFLVLNILLSQAGLKPVRMSDNQKGEYIKLLRAAQHPSHPDIDSLITFIARYEVEMFQNMK